ncbi:MAG: IclR family transcriptional regulator [Ilumatobacteraceae bacterium]
MGDQLSTVTKTLRVLEAFSYAEPVLGVSELARKLDMGKSSVHRALSTLLERGYVTKTADDRYRFGLKLHEMGQRVVSGLRCTRSPTDRWSGCAPSARRPCTWPCSTAPTLERFESAGLAMLHRVGLRMPAYVTSSGKCLLAFASDPAATDRVLAAGLRRRAPRSITSKALLLDALARVRDDGYAVSIEESEPKVSSVGAPVFGRGGLCIAAVSIVGPTVRFDADHLPKYVRQVRRCAMSISKEMGFGGRLQLTG